MSINITHSPNPDPNLTQEACGRWKLHQRPAVVSDPKPEPGLGPDPEPPEFYMGDL